MSNCHGCSNCGPVTVVEPPRPGSQSESRLSVALIGPPNSGKTTLFNRLTGLRQKVANFPGVTVEQHVGVAPLPDGRAVRVIDLPGVYSLEPRSEDERVAHDVLRGLRPDTEKPQAVLLVLDSTNLSRQLMLAAPILSIGLPTLILLNLSDDLKKRGGKVDAKALAAQLGAPVALISARRGDGIDQVFDFLAGALPKPQPVLLPVLQDVPHCRRWAGDVGSKAGYRAPGPNKWTRKLDEILLHPVMGPLAFLVVVIAVFQAMFTIGAPLQDLVQKRLFDATEAKFVTMMPPSLLTSILIDGVWHGVGAVLVFLPQILLLFLFIGVLEDSGYLARAAVIADRTMARVGLQGKSFIPLLSAYGCAVPAIMATRTIENKRDRIATILIAPFITCPARMQVYTLIILACVPKRNLLGPLLTWQALAMLGLYVLGLLAAVMTARLLKSTVLKSSRAPFVMEMPSYRLPSLQSLGLRLLDRGMVFLKQAGSIILIVTVILAILLHLPYANGSSPEIGHSVAGMVGHGIEPLIKPLGLNWKAGIGLITSLAAREAFVGTMGTIYGAEHEATSSSLQVALHQDLSFGGAIALLVFFAFALQCMSTVAIVRRETASWKWPLAQFAYMGALAWVGAFAAYHLF